MIEVTRCLHQYFCYEDFDTCLVHHGFVDKTCSIELYKHPSPNAHWRSNIDSATETSSVRVMLLFIFVDLHWAFSHCTLACRRRPRLQIVSLDVPRERSQMRFRTSQRTFMRFVLYVIHCTQFSFYLQPSSVVLRKVLHHSALGHDVVQGLASLGEQRNTPSGSQLAQNVSNLFSSLPPRSPVRAPLAAILTENLPVDEAASLSGSSSRFIYKARQLPLNSDSLLFCESTPGLKRRKVSEVERNALSDWMKEQCIIKYDQAHQPSFYHYEGEGAFFEAYKDHLGDIIQGVVDMLSAGLFSSDETLTRHLRENIERLYKRIYYFEMLDKKLPPAVKQEQLVVDHILSFLCEPFQARSRSFFDQIKRSNKIHHIRKSFLGCECEVRRARSASLPCGASSSCAILRCLYQSHSLRSRLVTDVSTLSFGFRLVVRCPSFLPRKSV